MKMKGEHDEDTTAATDISDHQGVEGYGQKGDQLDMRFIIGAILILGGLWVAGVFDERLAELGLNAHACIEYASGWRCG